MDRFAILGREVGVASGEDSDSIAAQKFLDALNALVEELETPTLEAYGIDHDEFFTVMEKMADDALESGSPQNTIKPVTKEDILNLYASLWNE